MTSLGFSVTKNLWKELSEMRTMFNTLKMGFSEGGTVPCEWGSNF